MYHRLLAMMLCAMLLFGLTACGSAEPAQEYDYSIVPGMLPSDLPTDSTKEPAEDETSASSPEPDVNDAEAENSRQEPEKDVQPAETTPPVQEPSAAEVPPPAQTTPPANETQPEEVKNKVLIAYFTWAENTVVEDPSAVDVDATTSASVLAPGHVAQMASWIQEETGGDLFTIVTTEPYSSDYDECLDRAADEKADNARPSLTGSVRNMADYDVVFLGYPDWWATCPMAVFTFLESYDFTGKTVIPFCAHGTSGLASSVRDIKAALPGVTVLDAVGVQRPGMDTPLENARSTVTSWLAGLEY